MAPPVKKNPIERRLDELMGMWNGFVANPQARLLRWLADTDNAGLVDTFVEMQRQGGGGVPDLFIRFETPFEPKRYGLALLEELRSQYEEAQPDLVEAGLDPGWSCPAPAQGETDVKAFARACTALARHYQGILENLVVALVPKGTVEPAAWRQWLLALVRADLPANVRALVLDRTEAPDLEELAQAEPERVVTVKVDLDMPGAYTELVRDVKGSGPGFDFRRYYVALSNAAGKGDIAGAQQAGAAALAIATQQNWAPLQAAVHMALGAVFLGAAQLAEALACYRSAGQAADAATKAGDETGPKLLLPARFAEGAALLNAGQFAEAARVYEATAPVAAAQQDGLMTFEAWRMAAYCHETNKQPQLAWACGQKALEAGAALQPEQRANALLPFVGQLLLRLTKQRPYRDQGDAVRRRLTELVGRDWEQRTVT